LDLQGNIPSFIWIADGKVHDVKVLDELIPEPGAIYIMDRGYLDFERLCKLQQNSSFFNDTYKIQYRLSSAILEKG
jgi:hypothetical protein